MEIKEIKADELHNLYQTDPNYEPLGLFWRHDTDTGLYIGIDNSTGDAWTEEFETKEAMLRWLGGLEDDDVSCPICKSYELNPLELQYYHCKKCNSSWDETVRRRVQHED